MLANLCRLAFGVLLVSVDVTAVWAQMAAGFVPVVPCRVVDTRQSPGLLSGPTMQADSTRSFPIPSGSCGIPPNASAYSVNVTVVPQGILGYLTIWATGQSKPIAATLSSYGQVNSNAAIVPAGTGGAVSVYVTNTTDVLFDINGYFLPATSSTESTAVGAGASSAGSVNTAVGFQALQANNTGNANAAIGAGALSSNTFGSNNVGVGSSALGFNVTGSANTAVGAAALLNDLIGNSDTGLGFSALWSNTTGSGNTAVGTRSLYGNTTGGNNTAIGQQALQNSVNGSWNIALGSGAGDQISNGSYNIDIGNAGTSSDSNVIRIGSISNQMSTFIAGINGVNIVNGSTVLINSNGQLGTIQSSARYKEDIHDMGNASDGLMRLRPVTFYYKGSSDKGVAPLQYGLIGEEVADVYPELAVRGQDGAIESVQYHELPALLLNELQKQHEVIAKQELQMDDKSSEIDQQMKEIRSLKFRIDALEALVKSFRQKGNKSQIR